MFFMVCGEDTEVYNNAYTAMYYLVLVTALVVSYSYG